MKQTVVLLLALGLFTNCAHRVTRAGYQVYNPDHQECSTLVKKNIVIPDSVATKVGAAELKDSGFSVVCNEEDAIRLLQQEACGLDADLIVITNEKRPGLLSSCYRCSAEFYQFHPGISAEGIESDEAYSPENLQKRVARDRVNNFIYGVGAVLVGVVLGTLVFL